MCYWNHVHLSETTARSNPKLQQEPERPSDLSETSGLRERELSFESPTLPQESIRNVYRLIYHNGDFRLQTVEEVKGDFKSRRNRSADPGEWSCRLVNGSGDVLAEEIITAPDHFCTVLDPHLSASREAPQATSMHFDGPHVFQLRLPRSDKAKEIQIHRVTWTTETGDSGNVIEELLAVIPINR